MERRDSGDPGALLSELRAEKQKADSRASQRAGGLTTCCFSDSDGIYTSYVGDRGRDLNNHDPTLLGEQLASYIHVSMVGRKDREGTIVFKEARYVMQHNVDPTALGQK